MKRRASAHWKGDLKTGQGTLSAESGVLDSQPYGFQTRFGEKKGTNPEELIAAAHAGCFSMALSMMLTENGATVEDIRTEAAVSLEKDGDGFRIAKVHLDVTVALSGMSAEDFLDTAESAKKNCPVSKVLRADITMDARLADA